MSMTEDEMYELDVNVRLQARRQEESDSDLRAEIDVLRDQVLTLTAIIATAAPSLRRNEKSACWRDYGVMNCWRDGKYSVVVWPDEGVIAWRCYYRNKWLKQGSCENWADAKACAFEALHEHGWQPAGGKGKAKDKETIEPGGLKR